MTSSDSIRMEDLEWIGSGPLKELSMLVERGPLRVMNPQLNNVAALIERGYAAEIVHHSFENPQYAATVKGGALYRMYYGGAETIAAAKSNRLLGR